MITKIKKVYYCEFCKRKHSLRRDTLEEHEKHCTMNPDRDCRLCGNRYPTDLLFLIRKYANRYRMIDEETPYHTISQRVEWYEEPVTLKDIMDDVTGCPNCTLAILRLNGDLGYVIEGDFDYKAELKRWWADRDDDVV